MYTRGSIALVHENGRICYEGALTNSDGSDPTAVAAEEGVAQAEQAVSRAEDEVARGVRGAKKRLAQAEEQLELAMAAVLSAEAGDADAESPELSTDDDNGGDDDEEDGKAPKDEGSDAEHDLHITEKPAPVSFSQVNTSADAATIQRDFPRFAAEQPIFCDIHEGAFFLAGL